MVLKEELAFYLLIVIFALTVSFLAIASNGYGDYFTLVIRLLALNGYIMLAVAAIMTPFLKEITLLFRKSFVKVHHVFAAAGLVLITSHPIAVSIQALNLSVLLPNFESLYLFFFFGGVIALILIYGALFAAFLRKRIVNYWRPFHALIYLALFVGVIHANFRGIDFSNIYFKVIYDSLFAGAFLAFGLKRWQFCRAKNRVHNNNLNSARRN